MERPIATPSSAVRIAGVVHVAPVPELRDAVERHWVVAWDHRDRPPVVQEVLPDPCVNLAVEPAGVLVHGVKTGRSRHELAGAGRVVGTKFRPGGFSGFAPGGVSVLTDRVVPAAELWGEAGAELTRRLEAAGTTAGLIEIVSAFLVRRRPAEDPGRDLVIRAVEAMADAPPGVRVGEIAARFGVSPRTLQRLFATHAGVSPKQVQQRFRHQDATDRLADGAPGLARLARELGYFDQAHFTHDFRGMMGRTPAAHAAE